jgi:GR25 family glycosyltransferase involved in LPS biosynthesis
MEAAIGMALERVAAADGAAFVAAGHPTECGIDPGVKRTVGEVGCVVSHMRLARKALEDGISHLVVFEDDCVPSDTFTIGGFAEYLRRVKEFSARFNIDHTDFVLLGTCGCYTWQYLAPGLKATNNFNGSHAYIMGRRMMKKLVDAYDTLIERDQTAPTDGLLPRLLQADKTWAFCPHGDTSLFKQDRSVVSYVVDEKPTLRLD